MWKGGCAAAYPSFSYYTTSCWFAGNLLPKSFWNPIDDSHIPIVDSDLLRGCQGILIQSFSQLHPLDKGMQDLRGQFRDFRVLSDILREPGDIAAGVFQFLQPCFCFWKSVFQFVLLSGIVLFQNLVLFLWDALQHSILVEPLE